jgi:PGF-pre-PGF domain-containing protein
MNIIGDDKNNVIIDRKGSEFGIKFRSNNSKIRNLTVTNCSNNAVAIHKGSFIIQDVTLDNLTIFDNGLGIHLQNTANCNITYCNIHSNGYLGLITEDSDNIRFENNTFTNDGLIITGENLSNYIHKVNNNTVNSKPLLYYKNQKNLLLNSEAGQIILANCTNITIKDITINDTLFGMRSAFSKYINISSCIFNNAPIQLYKTNFSNITYSDIYGHLNGDGINLPYSHNNTIIFNYIYNNTDDGIQLNNSNDNNISSNFIYNNFYGINLESSNNNKLYNNYFNNTIKNALDDGIDEPNNWNITKKKGINIIDGNYLGGNYWHDYIGNDTNHDGIGEATWTSNADITGGGQDNYPLVISPSVIDYEPTGYDAEINTNIIITFNKPMETSSVIDNLNIKNTETDSDITYSVVWSYSDTKLTINPNPDLDYETIYNVTLNWNASDKGGNLSTYNHTWEFTTEEEPYNVPGDQTDPEDTESNEDLPPTISNIYHEPTTVKKTDIITIYATVTDDHNLSSVKLFWNDGNLKQKTMTTSTSTNENIYSAQIGPFPEKTVVIYYINATDNNSQTTKSITKSFTVVDTTGPVINIITPRPGTTLYSRTPLIAASYSDISGIDTDSIIIEIDETEVKYNHTNTAKTMKYMPSGNLSYGTHTIVLKVSDKPGNQASKTWSFSIKRAIILTEENLENLTKNEEKIITSDTLNLIGIKNIRIRSKNNLESVKIHIVNINETEIPENVTKPKIKDIKKYITEIKLENITFHIYKYYDIELTSNNTYVEEDDLEFTEINFTVEKTWLHRNNINRSDMNINLMRYYKNQWQKINTTLIDEDGEYLYFTAKTPGFSTFAVVGGNIVEKSSLLSDDPDPPWTIIIGFIISALIVLIVILFKFGYIYIEREEEPP